MEIPRHWREMPTNMSFNGKEKNVKGVVPSFKFPGGEIPLVGKFEQIKEKFLKRGFREEVAEEILFTLLSAVTTESTVSMGEILENLTEFVRSEVREERRGKR